MITPVDGTAATSAVIPNPNTRIATVQAALQIVRQLRQSVLVENQDYGIIPGTAKPTLLQPGAEKMMAALELYPHFETLNEQLDFDRNFILYRYRCEIRDKQNHIVGMAIGSCNSWEKKYRYRWVKERDLPPTTDTSDLVSRQGIDEEFDFAIEKSETTGKYGKPASYWQRFHDAIANNTAEAITKKTRGGKSMKAWRITTIEYQVPNPEIWDQLNTIDKMAQKRAYVSAVKQAANASEYFTVDIEDLPEFSDFVEVSNPNPVPSSAPTSQPIEDAQLVDDDDMIPFPPSPKPQIFWADKDRVRGWLTTLQTTHGHQNEELMNFATRALGYINKRLSTSYKGFSNLPADITAQDAAKIIASEAVLENDPATAAPKASGWSESQHTQFAELYKATFNTRPRDTFENELEAPLYSFETPILAINKCIETAIVNSWPFAISNIEYTTQKQLVLHLPKGLTADGLDIKAFGGRTQMKKWLGQTYSDLNAIDAWQPGEAYDIDPVWISDYHIAQTQGGHSYINVKKLTPVVPPEETTGTAQTTFDVEETEIPF